MARFAVIAALAVLPGAAAPPPDPGPPEVVVPLVVDTARVYAPIAGPRGPLGLFILDTGADNCVIDEGARGAAGAAIVAEAVLRGAGRGEWTAGETGPLRLSIADASLALPRAYVGPLNALLFPYDGRPVAGLLGATFFRQYVATVDFAGRRLELRDPSRFDYRGAGVRLPFRLVNGAPVIEGAITLPDGARIPLRLLVDLGAEANVLFTEPFARAHPQLAKLSPSVVEPLGAGIGGETRFAFARLPRLDIGPIAARDLVVGVSVGGALRDRTHDALLGARFLRNYRATFDYARRELILEPNAESQPDRFDRSGAFIVQDPRAPHRFLVHAVAPGTPAAEAGLEPGDVLQSLAGHPTAALDLDQIRDILSAEVDQPVAASLMRGGKPFDARLRLRALL